MKILSKTLLILFAVTSFASVQPKYYLASGSDDKTIRIWEWDKKTKTWKQKGKPLTGHTGSVKSVAFSKDGRSLASGGARGDNKIRIWEWDKKTKTWKQTGKLLEGFLLTGVTSIAFSRDGKWLVSESDNGRIITWDTKTRKQKAILDGSWDSLALSQDGKLLASF